MKTASAALKAFIPSTRQFFEADLYTITPLGTNTVPPAFVQSTQTTAFSAVAYPSNNAGGNLLVAMGRFTAGAGTPTIADSKGNTWSLAHSIVSGGSIDMFWYAANCAAGANSVTVTANGRTFCQLVIAEYSGIVTASPLDQQSIANSGVNSTTALSPTITPTHAGNLVIGWCANETANSLTATAGSGFTVRQNSNGNVFLEDENISGLSSFSASIGLSSSVNWTAGIVTFKALASAGLTYTSCDRDIFWNTKTYASGGPLITRGGMKQSLGLTVDTLDLSIDVTPLNLYLGLPLLQQLSAGLLDGARFQLDRLFGTSFGNWVDSVTLFTGNIADIKELGRTRCNLQVRSRLELLNNSLPRMLFQPSCRWSLFDSGCNLLKPNFTTNYTVAAGSTALTIKSTAAQANGYYDLGTILFLTGPNAGFSATVKTYLLSSGTFTFHAPLPFAPVNGDSFAASAGCDKTFATCTGKFTNGINYGGQDFIPVPESAF